MNILLVSPLPPPIGGIASWTESYMRFCKENNINAYLVNSAIRGNRVKNIENRSVFDEIKRAHNIRISILKQLKENNIDVIHYNASCSTMGLLRDYFVLRGIKTKIFYQCHCDLAHVLGKNISKLAFRRVVGLVKGIFVLNSCSYEAAKEFTDNVTYIPNFIEKIYRPEPVINHDIKKICFVGRVVKEKGINELVKASKQFQEIEFHIIGPIDDIDKEILRKDNIKFYGAQSHDDVIKLLKSMDVYVLPSYTEGFPLGVLEAMSCGLPIIATDVGSIKDMIGSKGGILIQPKSCEDIIEAIKKIEPYKTREKMASYNISKVRSDYLIEEVMKNVLNIYHGLN